MKSLTGKVWKFGPDVDTDQIIPSQYLLHPTIAEMARFAFEPLRPEFASRVENGDILICRENFGCGSSREQAPRVLKELGVAAVVAVSFARIFYRNAINIGLPAIVCSDIVDQVEEGDVVEINLQQGHIEANGCRAKFQPFPEHVLNILTHGGLLQYLRVRGGKN